MKCSEANNLVFYCHTLLGKCVYFIVYVDYIAIKGNDATRILQLKEHINDEEHFCEIVEKIRSPCVFCILIG